MLLPTPSKPTLPNLLIIGAAKAGTTSIHRYLSLHPEVFMSVDKELNFFDQNMRWQRGIDWYKSNFNASYPVNGEASPQYTRYPRTTGVPKRIRSVLGTPKLIYCIRDPVDRIMSHYTHIMQSSVWPPERRSFNDVLGTIETEPEQYIEGSSYFLQISQYLDVFPRDALHIVILERLSADPRGTLRSIFRFLGVNEDVWASEFNSSFNVGEDKRLLSDWFERWVPSTIQKQLFQPTWVPWKVNRAVGWLSRMGGKKVRRPKISQEESSRLEELLATDVAALRQFLDDELSEWRSYV